MLFPGGFWQWLIIYDFRREHGHARVARQDALG
jgi:hypothetical protein